MKNLKLKTVLIVTLALTAFSACEDETDDLGVLEEITNMVEATSYTDWVYFSLSENKVVEVTDAENSTDWDLGFMRNHIRTNSGTSGNGNGGALDAGAIDFDSYTTAPESGYTVDESVQAFDFATMEYSPVAANTILELWGTFTDEMPPILEPSNKVFVVKTADGKYAKIIVMNYYGTEGSGYITFKYKYQPNGSTNLE